jgi:hypothetical protein
MTIRKVVLMRKLGVRVLLKLTRMGLVDFGSGCCDMHLSALFRPGGIFPEAG